MKRPVRPEEHRLWSMVASTVHPLPGRSQPVAPSASTEKPALGDAISAPRPGAGGLAAGPIPTGPALPPTTKSKVIEPGRRHRIAKERDPIGAHIDLHGMDQARARSVLEAFIFRSWNEGMRAVLVITGKGLRGDGVLRRMTPEWLADPRLRDVVAGISEAQRRHGGEGALYVALKRHPRAVSL